MKGIRPGTKQVLPKGGLNPEHYNAITEGGPRNGVMTALDDFVAEYDRPLRRLVLPVYFGLAIVVEEARLDAEPEFARAPRPLRVGGGQGHPVGDRGVDAAPGDPVPAQRLLRPAQPGHPCRRPVPRPARVGPARRAVPRSRAAHLVPRRLPATRQGRPSCQKLGDPVREMQLRWQKLADQRRAGALPARRARGLDAALHRHGPGADRTPPPVPRPAANRHGCRAISSSATPVGAARES